MAIIRIYSTIENDLWKLTFVNDPVALGEDDKKRMRMYGEPEINLGGTFLASTQNEFVLPSKMAKIRSDFPYTAEFDSTAVPFDTNTQTKVEAYRTAILARFDTAFTALRAITNTFVTEVTHNI
jgi:hypothetical protein